jgi:hypothetical protein
VIDRIKVHRGNGMSSVKRNWSKPRLIVLGRGKPEENIMLKCKNGQPKLGCDISQVGRPS